MVGFTLPKVGIKQSIVKVKVEYLPDLVEFTATTQVLHHSSSIIGAIEQLSNIG